MNTLEQAITFIQENKAPFWKLLVRYNGGTSFSKLYQYEPNPDPEVDKIGDSVNQLVRKLSFQFHPTAEYELFAKTSATGTKETEFGPFLFKHLSGPQTQAVSGSINGLGNANTLPGFSGTTVDLLGSLNQINTMREGVLLEKMQTMLELQSQKNELEREREKLKDLQEKLRKDEERFTNNSLSVADGTLKAFKILLDTWAPPGSGSEAAKSLINGLTGNSMPVEPSKEIPETEKPTETEHSPQIQLIMGIGDLIEEKVTDVNELKALGFLINEIVNSPEMLKNYASKIEAAKAQNQKTNVSLEPEA